MRAALLIAALVITGCGSTITATLNPPLSIVDTYGRLSSRMDARIGSLTAAEANQIWGRPQESAIDGNYLRVRWLQSKHPFPDLPEVPQPGTVQRSVLNLAASEGDGLEWPITSSLVLWFNSAGRMVRWQTELQEGSIYQQAPN